MYVLDVIPLSRTAPGLLSYRSRTDLAAGTIVDITVRKTRTQGIVVGSSPVSEAKSMLKTARFVLSKSDPSPAGTLPAAVMQAARSVAAYHATTIGAVLSAMFSEHMRLDAPVSASPLSSGDGFREQYAERSLPGRAQAYREFIKERSASGEAVLLLVPTLAEIEYWKAELREFSPLCLSGAVPPKKRSDLLAKAASHSGLVIATPSFAWIPLRDLGGIIVERCSAGTYTLPKRPYLSVVRAARAIAEARSIPCMLGDYPLPLEYRPDPSSSPSEVPQNISILDARRDEGDESPWKAVPEPVLEGMRKELASGGRTVVIATRSGYAPSVVCRDCGQAQTDDRGVPLSFSIAGDTRMFYSSDGVSAIDAKRPCQRCESWNLVPLGVGIERVAEQMRADFKDAEIAVISPESLQSPAKARSALKSAGESAITIGTEALIPWLYARPGEKPLVLGVVASADSLLALPFWKSRERFIRLAYLLSGIAARVQVITRRPDDSAVESLTPDTSGEFWKEETVLRKALRYPPFGTLITVTAEGSQAAIAEHLGSVMNQAAAYAPKLLPPRPSARGGWSQALVIAAEQEVWPDPALSALLSSLPPVFRVRIDSESFGW
jgi:primosomal protein N' (replication factor Y)